MKISDQIGILSQIINFIIFIYFAIILIKTNPVDIINIIIAGIGLIMSIIVSILGAIENLRENQLRKHLN